MQGSASFGLSVDVYACLDQQSAGGPAGLDGGGGKRLAKTEGKDCERLQRRHKLQRYASKPASKLDNVSNFS